MNENETHRHLRRWDPAAGADAPSQELYARIRAGLADAERESARPGWLGRRWFLATAALAGALLVAVTLVRLERGGPPHGDRAATTAPPEPTQVIYTASNGVRIYWSVPAQSNSKL